MQGTYIWKEEKSMNKQRRTKINEALVLIDRAREILEEVRDEEQESFDNLPEGLQEGERG